MSPVKPGHTLLDDTAKIQPARRFNHDLGIDARDQKSIHDLWPDLVPILIDPDLIERFRPSEAQAKRLKLRIQRVGTLAVFLLVFSLIGSVVELWIGHSVPGHSVPDSRPLRLAIEISAISGIVCALLASRMGPWRKPWLTSRFMTEVLRQWHFRHLLDGAKVNLGTGDEKQKETYALERTRDFQTLLNKLEGVEGQQMDRLTESGADVLGSIPKAHLPADNAIRSQLLDAYARLRLEHQLLYASWKLGTEDQTFMGFSSLVLVDLADKIAGSTLLFALALSAVHMFIHIDWAPLVAVMLSVVGVGVRTWRDGLALQDERERYQEMRHRLELLTDRWNNATSHERQFQLAEEVEQLAIEELRGFIRSHERAQFLF